MQTIIFLRQFKILNYAIFDFIATFLFIAIIAPILSFLFKKININIPKKNWFFLALPIAILVHILTNQYTPMTKNFLDPTGHYILKITIIVLFALGIKNIKLNKKNIK